MKKVMICTGMAVLIVLGLLCAKTPGDDPRVAQALRLIEIWIDAQLDYKDIPGMSAAIVSDQDLIWSRGFGLAHVETNGETTPRTIFSICSISKLFTSTAIMRLRDEGRLSLDAPLETYLPWFDIRDTFPDAPPVTLRGILTHSSGLPREADFPYWTGPDHPFPTKEEIKGALSGQEELYPAQTYFQYSNLGMSLAGYVVEAVSGQPYDAYIQEHILDPLGMTDTAPEIPADKRGGQLATGYSGRLREGGRLPIDFYQVRGVAPAAGFSSTVEDLGRFASWQFRLLERGGEEILDSDTLREMQRVHWMDPDWETTWGLGFSVSRREGKTYVGHGGSCPGYRTQLSLRVKDKLAVIVMTNAHDVSPGNYGTEIFNIIAPALTAAKGKTAAKKAGRDFSKYIGRYLRPVGRESHVLAWDDGLAMISLPSDRPGRGLTRLKHVEGSVFRRVRKDGELGERYLFELDTEGRVTRLVHNSQYAIRDR